MSVLFIDCGSYYFFFKFLRLGFIYKVCCCEEVRFVGFGLIKIVLGWGL